MQQGAPRLIVGVKARKAPQSPNPRLSRRPGFMRLRQRQSRGRKEKDETAVWLETREKPGKRPRNETEGRERQRRPETREMSQRDGQRCWG